MTLKMPIPTQTLVNQAHPSRGQGLAGKSSRTDVHTWMGCPGEVPGNAHSWLVLFLVTAVRADVDGRK